MFEEGDAESDCLEGPSTVELDASEKKPLINCRMDADMKDRCNISFMIFYLLGLGSLLPWNFFITANEYWMYKLRDVTNSTNSTTTVSPVSATHAYGNATQHESSNDTPIPTFNSLQLLFMNALSICAMLPNVVFQFLNTLLQKGISQNIRVLGTLFLMVLLFGLTEALVRIDVSTWQYTFFVITLITVALINSCSAIFQSSVFGLAACFPRKFSGAVMAGQGMGGVFAALAMIGALAYSSGPIDSAFIYFLTAIVVLTLTIVMYGLLLKQEFYIHHSIVLQGNRVGKEVSLEEKQRLNINEGDETNEILITKKESSEEDEDSCRNVVANNAEIMPPKEYSTPITSVIRKIWLHMFCIVFTFFITLSCYPAITANINSMTSGTEWNDVYFSPVCCFLLFNLSDWLGRTSASYLHYPSPKNKLALFILTLTRLCFPILFAYCNVQPRSLPVFFANDTYFIVFMFFFGISNGHISTLCMQYGPKEVPHNDAATAGSMLAFMISVGLFAGAGASFLVKSLI